MRYRTPLVLLVAAVCAGGCTTTGSVPATAPLTTASAPTSPGPETTTTMPSTTTTIDRLTEITRIIEDLERRRLAAIYAGDVEAFRTLFADTPYLERSLEVFDLVEPGTPPEISIDVLEVLRDDSTCLAVYYQATLAGQGTSIPATAVLTPHESTYVYAFTNDGRGGWLCDGPHPLS